MRNRGDAAEHTPEHPHVRVITRALGRIGANGQPPQSAAGGERTGADTRPTFASRATIQRVVGRNGNKTRDGAGDQKDRKGSAIPRRRAVRRHPMKVSHTGRFEMKSIIIVVAVVLAASAAQAQRFTYTREQVYQYAPESRSWTAAQWRKFDRGAQCGYRNTTRL